MSEKGDCRPVHFVDLGLVWVSLINSLIENKHDPIKFDIRITMHEGIKRKTPFSYGSAIFSLLK